MKVQKLLVFTALLALVVACTGETGEDTTPTTAAEPTPTTAAEPTPTTAAEPTPTTAAEELEVVRFLLGVPAGLVYTTPLVAEDRNLYEEFGIQLEVEATGGSGFTTQQLVAGNAPFGKPAAGDVFLANQQGADLRFLGCYHQENLFAVVVPEDSDVQSMEDLDGQTIGVSELGGGEFPTLRAALLSAGLDPEADVELLPIGEGGAQTVQAIEDGTVQAYSTSFTDLVALEVAGVALRNITPESLLNVPGACLVGSEAEIQADPERAQKVTDLWLETVRITIEESDQVYDMICSELPEQCDNEDFARALFANNNRLIHPSSDVVLGGVSAEALQTLAEVMAGAGLLEEVPDVTEYISEYAVEG